MITVKRKGKTLSSRRLVFLEEGKQIGYAVECCGWFATAVSNDNYIECRRLVMENLYWLLNHNTTGLSDQEYWEKQVEHWNQGKGASRLPASVQSLFFNDEEMKIALNSIDNK